MIDFEEIKDNPKRQHNYLQTLINRLNSRLKHNNISFTYCFDHEGNYRLFMDLGDNTRGYILYIKTFKEFYTIISRWESQNMWDTYIQIFENLDLSKKNLSL